MQLLAAAQNLRGEDMDQFKILIREVATIIGVVPPVKVPE